MLCDKDWMLTPRGLFAIVPGLSGRQTGFDEDPSLVHNGVNPLDLELFEFFPLEPEPASEG